MLLSTLKERKQQGRKSLAVLIDPDNVTAAELVEVTEAAEASGADLLFVGGSLMVTDRLDEYIRIIKAHCSLPVILFPGSALQISNEADAILFLSLISGRNAELLIGHHVLAAPYLKATSLEILPTGYMLVDGGNATTVSYMSNSTPIPHDKPPIAVSTAMAGEMLGLRMMYMDAGSGANRTISPEMIAKVAQNIEVPLIVGGGIDSPEKAAALVQAGADVVVVGNAIEREVGLIKQIADSIKSRTNEPHRNF